MIPLKDVVATVMEHIDGTSLAPVIAPPDSDRFPDAIWVSAFDYAAKEKPVLKDVSLSRRKAGRENIFALTIPHRVVNHDVSYYIGARRWVPEDMLAVATSTWAPTLARTKTAGGRALSRLEMNCDTCIVGVRAIRLHDVFAASDLVQIAIAATFAADVITSVALVFPLRLDDLLPHLQHLPNLCELRGPFPTQEQIRFILRRGAPAPKISPNGADEKSPSNSAATGHSSFGAGPPGHPPQDDGDGSDNTSFPTIRRFVVQASDLRKGHALYFPRNATTTHLTDPNDKASSRKPRLTFSSDVATFMNSRNDTNASLFQNTTKGEMPVAWYLTGLCDEPLTLTSVEETRHGKMGTAKLLLTGTDMAGGVEKSIIVFSSVAVTVAMESLLLERD